ncbi:MAG: PD-(D/E)XK nuclease-like domain-containing protein [Acidiferrobacteraceae bacterium]
MTLKAGIHSLAADAYHADEINEQPTLNASVLKHLVADSPLHAWTAHAKLNPGYVEKTASRFDVGTAAHAIFLEGADHRVHVVQANDWRTKAAQEVRDRARAEGLIPLLAHEWERVSALLVALRTQVAQINAEPPLFHAAGKPEQTLIWEDRGVWCRALIDWFHDDLSTVDDLKTTGLSANPHTWGDRTMFSIGADIQAAFTLRGLRKALGVESTFRFVVIETSEPYAACALTPSTQALELANAKIDRGLDRWKRCLETGEWPGYAREVLTVDPPPWMEARWFEAQALEGELGQAA